MNEEKRKTTTQLNEEAINAMCMTDKEFEEYKLSLERDFRINKWKYISLYERAITKNRILKKGV